MADKYTKFVSSGAGKSIAKQLGLPQPVRLRRFQAGEPLLTGPVLVLGPTGAKGVDTEADRVAQTLLSWELDVRRTAPEDRKLAAIVVVLSEVAAPGELGQWLLPAGPALKKLQSSGRVVVVSRTFADDDAPLLAAARGAVPGVVRSLGKELRAGATANGVQLAPEVAVDAPSAVSALRFFLSANSAFVTGQLLRVDGAGAGLPQDWEQPLADKVALVTGAARGIGADIARVLARQGARLVVVDLPAAGESLAKVANELSAVAIQLDITAADAGEQLAEQLQTRFGGLDILVHNAGITRDKLLANMDEARWDSVIAVNLESQLRITQTLLDAGALKPGFRQVALASTSGIAGTKGQTNYAASKAGVMAAARATAPLLKDLQGTANAVAPGFIETEMTAAMPLVPRETARRLSSLAQGGLPVDVAETIAFLAAPASGGINGQTLRVCGQLMVGA